MLTSNPICQPCGLEMYVAGIGWLAIYMAGDPPTPYEVRWGDVCQCRKCEHVVMTKFAVAPPMGHFMGEAFEQQIQTAMNSGKFVVVWERVGDRANLYVDLREYVQHWLTERLAAREERK